MDSNQSLIPPERIERAILVVRGQKVMLDADLAALYGVETKMLVRAIKRNISRFPPDFMFQLSKEEFDNLRFHFGTSSDWGGRRYPPYAFTEQGVAMLSSGTKTACHRISQRGRMKTGEDYLTSRFVRSRPFLSRLEAAIRRSLQELRYGI